MKKLTTGTMWLFAIGQLGWATLSGIIVNWLVYFYQPDQITQAGQQLFIPQGTILGMITVIGLISAIGRIFDAFADPCIASLSDRCKHKDGRRIPFMRAASIPFTILTVLVFIAPVNHISLWNVLWLLLTSLGFYLCLTFYCTPFNALIPELGKTQQERLNISTYISLTFILGTAIAYLAPVIWGIFEPFLGKTNAMRVTFASMALFALICMLIPVFTIKEKEYVNSTPSDNDVFTSLIKTFKNKSFRIFVASDIFYWIALTIFQTGLPFYITSLLKLKESMTTILFVAMTACSLVFYIPVNLLAKKVGKKPLVILAFVMFSVTYCFTGITGESLGISTTIQSFIMVVLASFPMAIFGILPQAMVADIAQADSIITGENREGMFYAARTFAFKLGQSISMLLFTGIATIGAVGSGLGYRLTAFSATFFCIIGGIILLKYNEANIYKIISNKSKTK